MVAGAVRIYMADVGCGQKWWKEANHEFSKPVHHNNKKQAIFQLNHKKTKTKPTNTILKA
jgi:hypothetical protein